MKNASAADGTGSVVVRDVRLRVSSLVVATMLVFSALLMVQHRADASPVKAPAAVTAQINVASIACPILFAVRAAFAATPFGGFVTPIINRLLAAFGCIPSPG